ncbi:MAG: hypothetical protein GDA44_07350 [Prochloron sp. SP5CPC1]|nr:hypothetical protein [Candidatus Paraprochloron terpiosi SP5CPC1]
MISSYSPLWRTKIVSQKISITNDVLLEEKKRIFLKELAAAYEEQANSPEFQEEIAVWDVTVDDGLNA